MNVYVLIPLFALMIPIVAIVAASVNKLIKLREKQLEQQSIMSAEKAAQYAAHTDRLEQRVRVLERIITDGGHDLSAEIEKLRDDRVN
jgi:hypothetical protein